MDSTAFLEQVITTNEGYLELCTRYQGKWQQYFYSYPEHIQEVVRTAEECQEDCDVYFSSHLFSKKDSHKDNVLPTRTIQQDLDYADIASLPLIPSLLNETSPSRHQGFWIVTHDIHQAALEILSKRLAYSIPLCDKSGWPLGHKVRFPNTRNHKYTQEHKVTLISSSTKRYSPEDLEQLPEIDDASVDLDNDFINSPPIVYPIGPMELVESIKDKISAKVYAEYQLETPSSDRSVSLWALTLQCFKAGLSREQVFWIAYNSINNKFRDLRFNNLRELAKDVLRAEQQVLSASLNVKEAIVDLRKNTKLLISERKRAIYQLTLASMKTEGEFVASNDGRHYYMYQGRPLGIGEMSRPLKSLLDIKYGLNPTEPEHSYTMQSLMSYADNLPETISIGSLTHFDPISRTVLVHTGRRNVYAVTLESIRTVSNGEHGVIFQWDRIVEPFSADFDTDIDWPYTIFGPLDNVLNMSPDEARALLKVWTLFTILRKAANTRPILALFGQPGSSKTTTARKLYAFFYGRNLDISGVTNPISYDMATATLPLFVLDNMDTWEKWIPDRLAQSVGNTDVIIRKLYTDNQIIRLKRQAMIIVTAHDPKFGRADVSDRMIIISLQRFENMVPQIPFVDEAEIMAQVINNRNELWGAVLKDVQRVLATPLLETDLQLRIQDFAKLGEWIATATNSRELFRSALVKIRDAQKTFNLDEESILVGVLQRWLAKNNCNPKIKTQEELYQELLLMVNKEDMNQFTRVYKSSAHLGRRLSTLQSTLGSVMTIDFAVNPKGQREWKITCP